MIRLWRDQDGLGKWMCCFYLICASIDLWVGVVRGSMFTFFVGIFFLAMWRWSLYLGRQRKIRQKAIDWHDQVEKQRKNYRLN